MCVASCSNVCSGIERALGWFGRAAGPLEYPSQQPLALASKAGIKPQGVTQDVANSPAPIQRLIVFDVPLNNPFTLGIKTCFLRFTNAGLGGVVETVGGQNFGEAVKWVVQCRAQEVVVIQGILQRLVQ